MPSGPDASLPADALADFWVIEPRQHGVLSRVRELWYYRYMWWYFASQSVAMLKDLAHQQEVFLGGMFTQVLLMNTKKARNGNSRYARCKQRGGSVS